MKKAVDFLRGTVRVQTDGAQPEQVLNACATAGIEFWNPARKADGLTITIHRSQLARFRREGKRRGFSVAVVGMSGLPLFLQGLRKRYALFAAMVLCLGATWFSSFFVWEIRVTGNETVSTAEILAELNDLGVHIGCCRLTISQEYISNEMLQRIPELCWITVNTGGSRAEVKVREDVPAPEVLDQDAPVTVYAAKSGIIEKMTVLAGTAAHQVGDLVLAGETLVSCNTRPGGAGDLVHARAEVYARTWYEMALEMPLTVEQKQYTGETAHKTALIFAGNRINLYFDSGNPWDACDKIYTEKPWTLFGAVLPFTLVRETYKAYTVETWTIPEEEAQTQMEAQLLEMLQAAIGEEGEIRETDFAVETRDGVMTVTLRAECLERIDQARLATDAEMQRPQDQNEETATYG